MGKSSFTKNYFFINLYRVVVVLSTLITVPHVSRALGSELIGIYTYTSTVSSYFAMIGLLGTKNCGYREIACCENDRQIRSGAFWDLIFVRLSLYIPTVILFVIFCINNRYGIYQWIWLIEITSNFLDIEWFYNGINNFRGSTIRNVAAKLVTTLLIIVFVNDTKDLLVYIAIQTCGVLVGNLCLWVKMPSYVGKPFFTNGKYKYFFIQAAILAMPQLIESIYMMLDKIMLERFSGVVQVGYYGQTERIITILLSIVNAITLAYGPRVANALTDNRNDEVRAIISSATNFVFILSLPIGFGLLGVSDLVVPWLFGEEFLDVSDLLKIYGFSILLSGMNSVFAWLYLLNAKKDKQFIAVTVIGAVSDFIFNIILIPRFLAKGAIIATLGSFILMVIAGMYFSKNYIEAKVIMRSMIKPLSASIIMYLVIRVMSNSLGKGLIYVFLQIGIGAIVYFTALLMMKEDIVIQLIHKFQNIIIKNIKR